MELSPAAVNADRVVVSIVVSIVVVVVVVAVVWCTDRKSVV